MVDAFLDADILINLLRNFPSSLVWKSTQGKAIWGIAPAAWMQVIEGASNKIAQQRAGRFLKQFALIYPTQSEIDWAMQQLQIFYLSHNVDAFDCLIAAPAHRLQLPLYTRNLKHFTPLLGNLAQQPY